MLLKFSSIAKLVSDQVLSAFQNIPQEKMQELYQLFLCVVMKFVRNLREGYVKKQTFVISIVESMIENMGYMALKADFKACMV